MTEEKAEEPSTFLGFCAYVAVLGTVLCWIVAGILLLDTIMHYLRVGEKKSLSVVDALTHFSVAWAANPNDWFGLWKLLSATPLWLALLLTAVPTFVLVLAWVGEEEERPEQQGRLEE